MTVDEAKEKRCPIKPIFTYGEGRYGPAPFNDDCKADGCMAWRWCDPAIKNEGYCGLAGKE